MKDRKDLAMHIVILDGGSTNPGDVSWAPLRALGSVTVYDSTKPEEIVERAKNAEAVILNRNVISREIKIGRAHV